MKKSLNAWTVAEETGFEQMFKELKEAGFDGIELNVDKEGHSAHSLTLSTTAEELADIKKLSEKYDLPVISISTSLWGGKMGTDPEFSEKLRESPRLSEMSHHSPATLLRESFLPLRYLSCSPLLVSTDADS